jgi:hypothetical protein
MSTPDKARHSPAESPVDRLFRRRVVIELTAQELPLLDAAQARHGTKRRALVAALSAEARIEQLEHALADAERTATAAEKSTARDKQTTGKADAKLERELAAANKLIAKQQAALDRAAADATQAGHRSDQHQRDLEADLEARESELADLDAYVVDDLYCGRCGKWVDASEWAWQPTDAGGRYAFHQRCGDHAPGVVSASSWLAHRRD